MKYDDCKLIIAFQSGDSRAFDALYQRHAPRVLAFAYQMTGDMSEAEDVTQEVFIAAFKGLHTFRNQANVLTWLFAIGIRRWRDKQRHPPPRTVPYPDEGKAGNPLDLASMQCDTLKHNADLIAMQKTIGRLNTPLKEAFLLVVVQELTHREAAQVLACPVGTVKWRVAEALRQVRAGLQAEQETEETNVPCLLP